VKRLSLPTRRWLTSWLVLAILFAQVATAAYACPAYTMPCAMTMADGAQLDPDQPALCLQHCLAPSQALDQGNSVSVAVPAALPALVVELVPRSLSESAAWTTRDRARDRAPPPPHSILHCCYRI
jgi:hypothetical protein